MNKRNNKGFVLAFVVAFMALVIVLLTLIVLNCSYPVRLCSARSSQNTLALELERIGRDFTADGRVDGEYEDYYLECTINERLCVKTADQSKTLLTVEIKDGQVICWRYCDES